jgi:uncharacterized protein YbjT (DUF2867 family)
MNLLVLGATGATGRHVVQIARQSHAVSAFVRNRDKAQFPADVRVITGDATRTESLRAAIPGHEAVISCLGAPLRESFRSRPGAASAPGLIDAMREANARRLIVMSAMGAIDRGAVSLLFRIAIATVLHGIYADKDAMEPIIASSPLDWTIIRAANLRNGDATFVDDNPAKPLGLLSVVNRVAVARYMVGLLDAPESVRRVVYVTNRR